jgi:DNA-binding transcriptional MerR regulator
MEPGVGSNMSIGELAHAAGLTRRAVRFYVQQKLLPMPLGRGRGRHYDRAHLAQIRRIGELQQAGHSLDAIRRILSGAAGPEDVPAPRRARRARPVVAARLWTRVALADGVELHFDARRFSPDARALVKVRQLTRELLGVPNFEHEGDDDENDDDDDAAGARPAHRA